MLLFINIFLGTITVLMIVLTIGLAKLYKHVQLTTQSIQEDLNQVCTEISELSSTVNEFVKSDLHRLSDNTSSLIGSVNNLTTDINSKSRSLNCLFKPFSFLSSKIDSDSSDDEPASLSKTIPQVLNWLATGLLLIKTTKGFIKK